MGALWRMAVVVGGVGFGGRGSQFLPRGSWAPPRAWEAVVGAGLDAFGDLVYDLVALPPPPREINAD